MDAINLVVQSLSPLLMNNPEKMGDTGGSTMQAARAKYDPNEEAESSVYRDENGYVVFPTKGIFKSMIDAGKGVKIKGERRQARAIMVGSIINIMDTITQNVDFFQLRDRDGNPIKEYEIDSRRVVVGSAGVIRHRPKVTNWKAFITVVYHKDFFIQVPDFLSISERAGITVGLGDYRPEKTGTFGRYQIVEHELAEIDLAF